MPSSSISEYKLRGSPGSPIRDLRLAKSGSCHLVSLSLAFKMLAHGWTAIAMLWYTQMVCAMEGKWPAGSSFDRRIDQVSGK
jgi:hypothetical protein